MGDERTETAPRRVDILIPGQPYSKARPRVTGRGTYTPRAQKENAETIGWYVRAAFGGRPFLSNVAVGLVFYRSNKQRIDLDNLVKQVLDASNGIAWQDDSQVTMITARLEFDKTNPRTVAAFRGHTSSMNRGEAAMTEAACERCGADFTYRAYPSQQAPRYCSQGCTLDADCEECGKRFHKQDRRQRYCSKLCASASRTTRERIAYARRMAAAPRPRCADCGKELQRRGAVLCRKCWLASPNRRRKASVTRGTI